ncbi:hypothetical protein TSUD_372060 [Trifolium subterraneum]|uniref:Uncharacterized protein n=1 Tax=Trifolium subterraneum TaxID=3900 RepID=A0A2Z6M769_TRISU|nr:hypothetical protein TSUD_372060 [Trifolium subterraneum]
MTLLKPEPVQNPEPLHTSENIQETLPQTIPVSQVFETTFKATEHSHSSDPKQDKPTFDADKIQKVEMSSTSEDTPPKHLSPIILSE